MQNIWKIQLNCLYGDFDECVKRVVERFPEINAERWGTAHYNYRWIVVFVNPNHVKIHENYFGISCVEKENGDLDLFTAIESYGGYLKHIEDSPFETILCGSL